MRIVVLIACLMASTVGAQDQVSVHTASWPKGVDVPTQSSDYLFLEGENQSEKVTNDIFKNEEHKSRTLFRTAQYPNDKWWGAATAYDKSRFAQRGANKDMPWH